LNVIGQFSHNGIGLKTRVKFVISHWWVSIRITAKFLTHSYGLTVNCIEK